jgi:hypothetical protein
MSNVSAITVATNSAFSTSFEFSTLVFNNEINRIVAVIT